jgi:hypothetical protein
MAHPSPDTARPRPAPPGAVEPVFFANPKQVFEWLSGQGRWKVGMRTVYKHVREGRLRPGPDGRYSLAAVRRYARNHLPERATGLRADDNLEALQERKLREEIALKKAQREKIEFQREIAQGRFFPVADLEMELAARAAALITRIEYLVTTRSAEWCAAVRGEPARADELAAAIWEAITDDLSDYAALGEYQVIVLPEPAAENRKEDSSPPPDAVSGGR